MYTHCPSCDTCFEITQESLDIAQGKVRCGQCDHVFNALDNLYKDKPAKSASEFSETDPEIPKLSNTYNKNQFNTAEISIPEIDIKEKMERIVASLASATKELKNARQSATFHNDFVNKKFNHNDSPKIDELYPTEETPEIDETSDDINSLDL
ncbi:MAG: zinc-ribbon domain-containing protein, partial [Thiotrichaceae bacterium]|nr:zinc-ribbon domain-containing protein [Thiotrichaceae bacterium]